MVYVWFCRFFECYSIYVEKQTTILINSGVFFNFSKFLDTQDKFLDTQDILGDAIAVEWKKLWTKILVCKSSARIHRAELFYHTKSIKRNCIQEP